MRQIGVDAFDEAGAETTVGVPTRADCAVTVVGWDVGGAHVKAALMRQGRVVDAMQWACPLWLGTSRLDQVLADAHRRWPELGRCVHAVTMTGEMVDLFDDREQGVRQIAAQLASALPSPQFFAGDAGWCDATLAGLKWPHIASANWLATARHVARTLRGREGVLVDIGSTTTDLIAFRDGQVLTSSRSDAQRLEHSELVYHGVVRTPLCALARRIGWCGRELNVMNEFFATTADVYRLTGELDPAHDQHPSADNAPKDIHHTQARLGRMIGLDGRDGNAAQWLAFARAWRAQQLAELRGQLDRVLTAHGLGDDAVLVAAGCGAFLVGDLAPQRCRVDYAGQVARLAAGSAASLPGWVQVAAPAVAVAALVSTESR